MSSSKPLTNALSKGFADASIQVNWLFGEAAAMRKTQGLAGSAAATA